MQRFLSEDEEKHVARGLDNSALKTEIEASRAEATEVEKRVKELEGADEKIPAFYLVELERFFILAGILAERDLESEGTLVESATLRRRVYQAAAARIRRVTSGTPVSMANGEAAPLLLTPANKELSTAADGTPTEECSGAASLSNEERARTEKCDTRAIVTPGKQRNIPRR